MKIKEIKIENFRLLHDAEINLEEITTAIVGKNNSGKTSFSEIFHIFMNNKKFAYEDFSIKAHDSFQKAYEIYLSIDDDDNGETREQKQREIINTIPKIKLFLCLTYTKEDNWVNIKPFLTSLEESSELKILFEFAPKNSEKFFQNINDAIKKNETTLLEEVKSHFSNHYQILVRPYSDEEETNIVDISIVKKLLQCHFIEAQRNLEDTNSNHTRLSSIFQQQYDHLNRKEENTTEELNAATTNANKELEDKLNKFFKDFVDSFQDFGFPGLDKERLELISSLEVENLFKNNVRLVYNHDDNKLPEKYNGLGYKNLMYIISRILSFQILNEENKCDLNLLFIEEPEAHMHPQMQSVFIKNITKFLKSKNFNVQVIITTHSSHILTNAEFKTIRYFTKNDYHTKIKDLHRFHEELDEPETLEFLQQYLTLDKGELFFADKAILFEGVVERLLMPVFIKKIEKGGEELKLSEQYISYIEVGGAYMDKFKELLHFLEIKTLIITDIDSVEKKEEPDKNGTLRTKYVKSEILDGVDLYTSNACLKNWLPSKNNIKDLLNATLEEKTEEKVHVAFQTNVGKVGSLKCGRSFEEAFIIENPDYIFTNKDKLLSIKNELLDYGSKEEVYEYSFEIHDYIDRNKKKTDFAFDLLSHQEEWITPTYIQEGLVWLSQH